MKRARSRAGFARYLQTIQQEGQGVWRIELFDCIGMPEFMLQVLVDGPPTSGFFRVVFDMARGLATGQSECDCLLCGTPIGTRHMPRDMAALYAWRDDPKQALGFCICNGCHDDDKQALGGRITDYLKANLISDLRVLPSIAAAPEKAQ
jgi:hypothetical protein